MPNHIKYPVINGKKYCPDCAKTLDVNEFKPYRRHYVSRCNACLKSYAAKYRQRPEVKQAIKDYVKAYRSIPEKRLQLNAKKRQWLKSPEAKIRRNETRRLWTAKEKQRAVDYKGGKCQCCGYNACLAALDFHHLDPSTKESYTGGGIIPHWAFENNKKELDKCVLVCVRCHREIHAGIRNL